jgi:hypothetical protein
MKLVLHLLKTGFNLLQASCCFGYQNNPFLLGVLKLRRALSAFPKERNGCCIEIKQD